MVDPTEFIRSFEKEFDALLEKQVSEVEGVFFESLKRLELRRQSFEGPIQV